MAYVAAGRFDGYWAYDNHVWDVAGGVVLIREAGGIVTRADGSKLDPFEPDILATNVGCSKVKCCLSPLYFVTQVGVEIPLLLVRFFRTNATYLPMFPCLLSYLKLRSEDSPVSLKLPVSHFQC